MKKLLYSTYLTALVFGSNIVFGQSEAPIQIQDPLRGLTGDEPFTLTGLAIFFYQNLLKILIPLIFIALVWAGFRFVTAQGNKGKLDDAKLNLWNVIKGAVIILIAGAVIQVLGGTIAQLING